MLERRGRGGLLTGATKAVVRRSGGDAVQPHWAHAGDATALDLERAVFDRMSGMRQQGTAKDDTYKVLFLPQALGASPGQS